VDAEATARATIAAHPEQVAGWLASQPGAWGFLAGRAVLHERGRLGRRLTDPERRRVWAALWAALERERAGPPAPPT
jgi:hypothetical protein